MKKRILIGSVIGMTFLAVGCSAYRQNTPNEKLISAVIDGNLQGVKEVIESEAKIDLEDLGYYEITSFSVKDGKPQKDGRALAIALSDSDDDAVPIALLQAGACADDKEDSGGYLHEAIGNRSLELSKALLDKGADVNGGDQTPLEGLMSYVSPDMEDAEEKAELLVKRGARIDSRLMERCLVNKWRYLYAPEVLAWLEKIHQQVKLEPGLKAAIKGDNQTLCDLVRDEKTKKNEDTLLFAAANCNVKTLEEMEQAGYDFSIKDEYGMSLLHIAALCNTADVTAYLLKKGLDGEQVSEIGYQAITYAAIGGQEKTLKLFLDKGYDYQRGEIYKYEEEDELEVWTWIEACHYGSAKSIDSLLNTGYKPTKIEYNYGYATNIDSVFDELLKQNIPYNVSYNGNLAVNGATEKHAVRLIQMGAKVSNGTLYKAIEWRNHDLLKELLKKEIKQSREETTSPLVLAIKRGDPQSVRYLIEAGADVNQKIKSDDADKTPLHIAAGSPSTDILKYLIKQGGNVKAKDSEGNTPYEYAKEVDLRDNMELLKK